MLQQILETMCVDPELLELMAPEQKELLFRRMREEQLRRWNSREKELQKKPARKRTSRKVASYSLFIVSLDDRGLALPLQIQFLLGADGEPWTWVMGEHDRDLPYDELVRRGEKREREREEEEEREIRREAEEFAKQETGHILSLASETTSPTVYLSLFPSTSLLL